jgi:membrane-anchored protein YejM (alkaline phosphatase superfamily)
MMSNLIKIDNSNNDYETGKGLFQLSHLEYKLKNENEYSREREFKF